eukprot:TRINITY_DN1920_c0_g1_i1.p1 TRINITY_DN1920_c0_g1~~TRINITY_DN1920_c0_g1_i1.p1  ORF type:complete len:495 (-),score=107.81 TRINITY_DN1920_c0_g1_i1:45-1529(-)
MKLFRRSSRHSTKDPGRPEDSVSSPEQSPKSQQRASMSATQTASLDSIAASLATTGDDQSRRQSKKREQLGSPGSGMTPPTSPSSSSSSSTSTSSAVMNQRRVVSGKIILKARALYDYPLEGDTLALQDGEIKLLRFKKGDIVNVYEQDSSGWWAGEFEGNKGIFPGSYMETLRPEEYAVPTIAPKRVSTKKVAPAELEARDERIRQLETQVETLFLEKEELHKKFQSEKATMQSLYEEYKMKSADEILQLGRVIEARERELAGRDGSVVEDKKKIRELQLMLEQANAEISAKEVEFMALEIQSEDYKSKLAAAQAQNATASMNAASAAEVATLRSQLDESNRVRGHYEKMLTDTQTKLQEASKQIYALSTSPSSDRLAKDLQGQVDLLKRQLGEEVSHRKYAENDLAVMKERSSQSSEILMSERNRLEVALHSKVELEDRLEKVVGILGSIILKDDAQLTVSGIKLLLMKLRKGVESSLPTAADAARKNGPRT